MLSISPTLAASNTPYIVTVSGINFDPSLTGVTDPTTYTGVLLAKVCANFTCRGGVANANNGEPCAGTTDERMCTADAYVVPQQYSESKIATLKIGRVLKQCLRGH